MSVNKYDKESKKLIPIAKNQIQTSSKAIDDAVERATQDKQDQIQFPALPTASADNLGKVYQYIGETNTTYTSGVFYKCVFDGTMYEWKETSAGEIEKITSSQAADMWDGTYTHTADSFMDDVTANGVIAEVKSRLDEKANADDLGTAAAKDFSTTISEDGEDLPTSGAVHTQIQSRIAASEKGSANGVAELDAQGKVPSAQLPSFVDDVIEGFLNSEDGKFYSDVTYETEISGESGKIYVDISTNKSYRWSGSQFVEISESLALGETSTTAYRGDCGKTAYDDSQTNKANIGTMANLNTVEKGSLVGAVNELDSGKVNGSGMSLSVNTDGTLRVTYDDGQ